MKVVGVVMTLTVLASLLVTSAVPTSAAAGTLAWGVVSTPSAVGNVLTAGTGVNFLAAAADGKTLFALDTTSNLLYKSTNAGASWAAGVAVTAGAVDLVVSPDFATDNLVVVANAATVQVSTNGGTSFVTLTPVLGTGAITSADIGKYYADGITNILIGTTLGGDAISNAQRFPISGLGTWTGVGTIQLGGIGDFSVLDVKFSPSHATDGEIMAVYVNATNTVLSSRFGALEWNGFILPVNVNASITTTGATIAVASDYVGNIGAPILVGLRGDVAADDLFRISGRAGAAGASADLNIGGTGTPTSIRTVAIGGPAATATVLWSTTGGTVGRSAGLTTFAATVPAKAPTGVGSAFPVFGGTTAFVGTSGVDSGVSRSMDLGVTFDQVGLVNVGVIADMSILNLTTIDNNTMFVVMNNADVAVTGFGQRQVWKTTDAGATWVRVFTSGTAASLTAIISDAVASPAYATDSTVLLIDGSTLVRKSTNGGASFTPIAFPTGVSRAIMVDGTNFFGGGVTAGALFKAGRFSGATGIGASAVTSIAISPKDATKATIAVGLANGAVYQSTNDGVTFTLVGTAAPLTANAIVAYGTDGTLYAGGTGGVARWTTAWTNLNAVTAVGLAVVGDSTLYTADPTAATLGPPTVGAGYRSLKPTAATAAAAEFQNLNLSATSGFPTSGVGGTAASLDVVAATADNTLYVTETTTAIGTFLYTGRIYGFKDTLAIAPAQTAPAANAILTTVTSAAATWAAVTGATNYRVTLDAVESGDIVAATAPTVTLGSGTAIGALTNAAFTGGTTHSWSFRVSTPLFSRQSTSRNFTTALPAVNPQPVAVNPNPMLGAQDVAIDATFFWPAVVGATGYEFTIAEDIDPAEPNKFAIIDYSATTVTNAFPGRENLKYDTTYYWRVVPFNATGAKGAASVFFFTTVPKPEPVAEPTPPVVVQQQAPPQITLTIPPAEVTKVEPIPTYLLWAVIAVGAVLIIAVIVLIVRTRRIS